MCLPIQSTSLKSTAGEFRHPAKISNSDHIITVSIPTFFEKAEAEIEVTSLNSSDIASLKANDPFMYYSIPVARNAAMKGKDVDPSLLRVDAPSSSLAPNAEERTRKAPKISRKVTRRRRVSTECHPDLLLDELLCDPDVIETVSTSSEEGGLDDYFLSFLGKMPR